MDRIIIKDKVFKPFIDNATLEQAIDRLADKMNADFAGSTDIPVFLCVLNGSVMFTAAMMKRLEFPAEFVSIKLSSYQGTESTGKVRVPMGLTADITGRRVIVFEDIVDTGNTIVALKQILLDKGASDVRICTMLLKPEVYKKEEKIDYVAMEIPNAFIVGYGLDYDEIGRNLKDIYVIDK